jgi:hypothetical protein
MPFLCNSIGSPAPLWGDNFHPNFSSSTSSPFTTRQNTIVPANDKSDFELPDLQMIILALGKDYRRSASFLGGVHAVQFDDPYLWQWLGIGREGRRLSSSLLPGTLNSDADLFRKIIKYKFDDPEAAPERHDLYSARVAPH